jgi:casein kinase II subunit beta
MHSIGDTEDDDEYSGEGGWINWYCSLKGHEAIAEIDEEFLKDNFNLFGLRSRVQFYEHGLEMILSTESPDEEDLLDSEFVEIYREAVDLYALVHARYIVSPRGLQVMRAKYLKSMFGSCPRVNCDWQAVLPCGPTEELRVSTMRLYCPRCEQLYCAKSKKVDVDGAFFGPSFPQLFLQTYPNLIPLDPPRPFVPRVFGFKLHGRHSIIAKKLDEYADDLPTQAIEDDRGGSSAGSNLGNANDGGDSPRPGTQDPLQQGTRVIL